MAAQWPAVASFVQVEDSPLVLGPCSGASALFQLPAWQPCAMVVEAGGGLISIRWTIVLGPRRIDFRQDGSGMVQMRASAAWLPVETTWIDGPALCWNGVCAQGDIPLD